VKDLNEKELIKRVGRNIRNKRVLKRISQAALSYDADIQKTTVGRIERGEMNTSLATLYKISKALGCEVKDLFD